LLFESLLLPWDILLDKYSESNACSFSECYFFAISVVRNMHSVMATLSPETIAAMGGQMSPDMVKVATDMMKQLSPDDMERMVNLASTSQMPLPGGVPSGGAPLSTATDTVSAVPSTSRSGADLSTSGLRAMPETSLRSGVQTPGTNMPSMADFSPEMQEQMRKQMKDPAMRQVGIVGFVLDAVLREPSHLGFTLGTYGTSLDGSFFFSCLYGLLLAVLRSKECY
jgi:hypothetical protein